MECKTVLNAYEEFQPVMYDHFMKGYDAFNTIQEEVFIKENYPLAQNISVDYAILEKSTKCLCFTHYLRLE